VLAFRDCGDWSKATALPFLATSTKPDYDGMAELWFDDMEALLAARQSPQWKAASQDEVNFIDHKKVAYFVSEEHIIRDENAL